MHTSHTFQKGCQTKQLEHPSLSDIPRLGISRCLLGESVRYDGGHKRDRFLTDTLGSFVEWIPICPEVEAGLGTPREAMRLIGTPEHPKLVTHQTHIGLHEYHDSIFTAEDSRASPSQIGWICLQEGFSQLRDKASSSVSIRGTTFSKRNRYICSSISGIVSLDPS